MPPVKKTGIKIKKFLGLFDGKHKFQLIDNGDGTTMFRQSEKISGILVWLLNIENTKKGFELMNEKLKELTEEQSIQESFPKI